MISNVTARTWIINKIRKTEVLLKNLKPGKVYSIHVKNENRYHSVNQTSPTLYTQTGKTKNQEDI